MMCDEDVRRDEWTRVWTKIYLHMGTECQVKDVVGRWLMLENLRDGLRKG